LKSYELNNKHSGCLSLMGVFYDDLHIPSHSLFKKTWPWRAYGRMVELILRLCHDGGEWNLGNCTNLWRGLGGRMYNCGLEICIEATDAYAGWGN
jgi:hypothetical protein